MSNNSSTDTDKELNKLNESKYSDNINQIYIEILCNIIRKQNIKLLEKIAEEEMLPTRELINKYVITKTQVKNLLTTMNS
tara:strand:- start:1919 stop:2158 length:240 start_codon:yes stop_codon:yes gene_type:complete